MPTYSFICDNPECGFKMDRYVSIKYPKISECPQCHKKTFIRCIGSGGGFNLKGKGFYQNDYKQYDDAIKENNQMNQERADRAKEDSEF